MPKMYTYGQWLKTTQEIEAEIRDLLGSESAKAKTYYCTICQKNIVDAVNGFDTCDSCLQR